MYVQTTVLKYKKFWFFYIKFNYFADCRHIIVSLRNFEQWCNMSIFDKNDISQTTIAEKFPLALGS